MKKIVLVGGGGHCEVIIDIIRNSNEYEIAGITDVNNKEKKVLGFSIIGNDSMLKKLYNNGIEYGFICMGGIEKIKLRYDLYCNLKNIGFKLPVLMHNSSVVSSYAKVGEGTCIMAEAVINPGTNIGVNTVINTGAIIEHDCNIGGNVQISSGAVLAGGITIKDNVFIGIGTNIIPGITVGENSVIGAGSVVIRNIPDNVIAYGNPAKVVGKKE